VLFLLRGAEVAPELVEWLSERVGEPTATALRDALYGARTHVYLGADDQRRILHALAAAEDTPEGLEPVRTLIRFELESRGPEHA
jgi:hypothetical protein